MRREDLTRLEAAVRQANPMPDPGDLSGSAEAAAVALLIREKRDAMTTTRTPQLPTTESQPVPATTSRRIPAFVLGLAVTVLMIGGAVVLRPGGGSGPADQPATTSTLPPTNQPAPVDLATLVFPAADVPPFTARVVYDMNPLGTEEWIPVGARMSVQVLFAGPQRYLYEVLSIDPATADMEVFGVGPGLWILGDGDQAWIMEPGATASAWAENFGPARDLLWNSGFPAWDEICMTGEYTALGVEEVAGRMTSHGRCSTLTDDYELWVDTSTGIVMKLRGALGPRDLIPSTAAEGGFEITVLELGEVVLPPAPAGGPAVTSSLPPSTTADPTDDGFLEGTALVKGEPAPAISGPLLDGSAFHLKDLRGRPAVVFHWGRGVADLEQRMDDFQRLSEKWVGEVSFLGAPLEVLDEAQRIVERGGYTFDNIVCYRAEGNNHVELCEPGSVMDVWGLGWLAWVILDEDGNVVEVPMGRAGTFEHIDSAIDAVVNP